MKLNVCMLLPLEYEPDMRVVPQIGICTYLTNFGHQITWVISLEEGRKVQRFRSKGVEVFAIPYPNYFPGGSIFARFFNKIPNKLMRMYAILQIFKKEKYNLLFVRHDVFDGLIASYIKKRYKIPFVFELTNPLEMEWEHFRIDRMKPKLWYYLVARFNTMMRIYTMKKADLVLITTEGFIEGLVRKGISKSKMMPYPNGVDISSCQNKDGENIRERYYLVNSKVAIYVGIMHQARNLGILIEAFARVRHENNKVKLLMVGDGSDRKNLEELASRLGIREHVIFTGQVSQSEIPEFIASADAGLSPVPPLSFFKVSSPIKTLEYMAMGKPVVANEEIVEHKEVMKQSGGGVLVPFNKEAFAYAIAELLNDSEKAEKMGKRGYEWVVKNRSYEVLARKAEERFTGLLSLNI